MKTWTKRKVTSYGTPTIEVSINVYGNDELLPNELKRIADGLTDDVMLAVKARSGQPLSRINIQRNAK